MAFNYLNCVADRSLLYVPELFDMINVERMRTRSNDSRGENRRRDGRLSAGALRRLRIRRFVPKKRSIREQTFRKTTFVPKKRQIPEQTHGSDNLSTCGLGLCETVCRRNHRKAGRQGAVTCDAGRSFSGRAVFRRGRE